MADLNIQCPNCGKSHAIAEDVTVAALRCLHCGCPLTAAPEPVDLPTPAPEPAEPAQPVHLTLAVAGASLAKPGPGAVKVIREKTAPGVNTALGRKSSRRKYTPAVSTWIGWMLLVSISSGMIAVQCNAGGLKEYLPFYIAARNALLVLVGVLVIYQAWQESLSQGLLCLLIPPYLLLYAIAQVESNIVRALFFALLAGVGAEAWLMPQYSLVMGLGPGLNEVVETVNRVIESNKF